LNFAVNEFIIDFGGNVTGTGIGAAIDTLWSVVRDFFNIIFIFAIIYLGFKMILGSDDSGTKRALVYLIIAALLVNFSLFISKFIVDFSNILAEQVAIIYAGINGLVDDVEVPKVKEFSTKLISYLGTTKPEYGKSIATTQKFDAEAEEIVKNAVKTIKETM
jgi:hypothetical protein